ncbi:DUF3150 domain-containing protein, partial [Pseudomonas syringae]
TKLGIDVSKLPSASRKLIQEKIFPKEFLNNYGRLRDQANAVLDKGAAVRLEMGVITSRSEAVSKIKALNDIKSDWAKQLLIDSHRYEAICNERIAKIAAEAYKEGVGVDVVNTLVDALRKRQPTWEDFVTRMKFEYSAMPIQLELDENKVNFDPVLFQAQREGIVALREGVFGALVQYLSRESSDILKVLNGKKPQHGGYSINYRTVARIGEITAKLHGLAYVHQNVAPLALVIDEALAFMPKSVEKDLIMLASQFFNLIACLEAMGDQHELLARLRDKQPLVVVTQMPLIQVGAGAVAVANSIAQTSLATARKTIERKPLVSVVLPSAVASVAVDEDVDSDFSVEDDVEAPVAEQEEVSPTVSSSPFGALQFMGNNMFE